MGLEEGWKGSEDGGGKSDEDKWISKGDAGDMDGKGTEDGGWL